MSKFSVTKNGIPLSKKLYTWNEHTRTFSTKENELVLDFSGIDNCTFNTGHICTFNTGSYCTFNTGSYCTFNTGFDCTFKTSFDCTFNTGYNCTFKTGDNCTFKTGYNCTFTTNENCFVTRHDVKGVTEIPANKTIKLNECGITGYTIIEEKKKNPSCNGKIVEIDGKKYKLTEQ
jgi:uncharacterized cupin superfamily protein